MIEIPGVRRSVASAITLVIRSRTTVTTAAARNTRRSAPGDPRSAALAIFLFLLAGDAETRVGERVEPLEVYLLSALMAVPELVRAPVHPPERLVHVPKVAAFLRREQELFLPLHRVGALVGHVE